MSFKSFITAVALIVALPLACSTSSEAPGDDTRATSTSSAQPQTGATTSPSSSSDTGGPASSGTSAGTTTTSSEPDIDNQLFEPEGLPVSKLAGAGEGLHVVTLSLLRGAIGSELYAAIENQGETSACDPAISFEFFDDGEQSLAAWVGGLYVPSLYQRSDEPSTLIGCLDPGATGFVGSSVLPPEVVADQVGSVAYRFSYFSQEVLPFELLPIDSVNITQLEVADGATGSAFTGALENGLALTLVRPRVTIFTLNSVGRPLTMTTASAMTDLEPGASWIFESPAVSSPGVAQVAFPGFDSLLAD